VGVWEIHKQQTGKETTSTEKKRVNGRPAHREPRGNRGKGGPRGKTLPEHGDFKKGRIGEMHVQAVKKKPGKRNVRIDTAVPGEVTPARMKKEEQLGTLPVGGDSLPLKKTRRNLRKMSKDQSTQICTRPCLVVVA